MRFQVHQMDTHCQEALYKAMSKPDFYPHSVQQVTQKETHISKVFLTGDLVYKVKKPMDLGFLDFTSLASRRRFCELEVVLNRRLSDDVYLDVIPITLSGHRFGLAGPGTTIEYAVCMRQLPDTASMVALLKLGKIAKKQIEALAAVLADFYAFQKEVPYKQVRDSWENIRYACEENFKQTQWAVGNLLDLHHYRAVQSATRSFLNFNKDLFKCRSQDGRVCDGHGDLRCGHIYFTGPNRIQIIDCIEFNPRLRFIDIASDLAFLAMDLDFRGAASLGATLIDAYVRKTRDWQLYAVLPFYKCYRAMVRCKVNCIQSKEIGLGRQSPVFQSSKAGRYLSLAHRYAKHFGTPTVWVLCGLPAAGKSTMAHTLSEIMAIPVLGSDLIRKQLFGKKIQKPAILDFETGIYNPRANRITYDKMLQLAGKFLDENKSIVLDATFSHPEQRRQAIRMADDKRARIAFIECTAPDALIKKRLFQREGVPTVSDARMRHFKMLKQRFEPLKEINQASRLKVDTAQAIDDCIYAIMAWHHALPFEAGEDAGNSSHKQM